MKSHDTSALATLFHGDCLAILRNLPANWVHSVVTDPPAGINYKWLEWDGNRGGRSQWIAWLTQIMEESLRILKPGGYAVVWALPRTSHWTATALENAGFEIRDIIVHLFGDGVPRGRALNDGGRRKGEWATLKPGSEHWILCKKRISEKDILSNMRKYGTGTLNIDACRIPYRAHEQGTPKVNELGRFPTNALLGHSKSCSGEDYANDCPVHAINSPDVSRFFKVFYCPKSSGAERNDGYHVENNHLTVKSVRLMRYLARLITPPGGTVLDPFMGSGTTGIAAHQEGLEFIGIEKEPHYFKTAQQRIRRAAAIANADSVSCAAFPLS